MIDEPEFYVPEEKYFGEKIQEILVQDIEQKNGKAVFLSGFPYDEGTRRNGGRIGGAMGSTIFRRYLKERKIYLQRNLPIYDTGDIAAEKQLEDAHINLYQKHKQILLKLKSTEGILACIGGSNDQSYCNVRAFLQVYPDAKIGVINLDAHFDVRPLKQGKSHSGSPFRQMLQNQLFIKNGSKFIEFANKGSVCSNQHYKYLQEKGCPVYWLEKNIRTTEVPAESKYKTQAGYLFSQIMLQLTAQVDLVFVSFDVDSISSKFMPGVSAPSVIGGLTSTEAVEILQIAGLCEKVKLVDFSQFNPSVESIISSATLVQMFYSLCKAYSYRGEKKDSQ